MMSFWLACVALLALAVMFVVLPGWRRDARQVTPETVRRREENIALYRQRLAELDAEHRAGGLDDATHQALRDELDRTLLDDVEEGQGQGVAVQGRPHLLMALALLVVVSAVGLYGHQGALPDVAITDTLRQLQQDSQAGRDVQPGMQTLLRQLDARLAMAPDNDSLWVMAGRLYLDAGRYQDAARVYQQLLQRFPEDPQALAFTAQAEYLAAGRQGTPVVTSLIDRALVADPRQPTALSLRGMIAFEKQDYRTAVTSWETLLAAVDPASEEAGVIREGVARARQALGEPVPEAASQPSITVQLALGEGVEAKPGDTVFLFARAAKGPPMPLAAKRLPAGSLPVTLTLGDADAMSPGMKMSLFDEVQITARLSRSGMPQAQSGDVESSSEPLRWKAHSGPLQLTIDRIVP